MDEIELRLASIETALIEVMGLIDPGALADAARSLRERAAQDAPLSVSEYQARQG